MTVDRTMDAGYRESGEGRAGLGERGEGCMGARRGGSENEDGEFGRQPHVEWDEEGSKGGSFSQVSLV